MTWRAMLCVLLCAGRAQAQTAAALADYLSVSAQTPEDYVLSKFATYDLVLIGEPHWVRQHVTLVGGLIPRLHTRGVDILAIEFARRIDQALIDSLLNAAEYDERLARRITMQSLIQWGYQEYVDLYRAAWQVNRELAPGATRFRILALGGAPDYSVIRTREDLDNPRVRRMVLHGESERDWATLLIDSVLATTQKALVYWHPPRVHEVRPAHRVRWHVRAQGGFAVRPVSARVRAGTALHDRSARPVAWRRRLWLTARAARRWADRRGPGIGGEGVATRRIRPERHPLWRNGLGDCRIQARPRTVHDGQVRGWLYLCRSDVSVRAGHADRGFHRREQYRLCASHSADPADRTASIASFNQAIAATLEGAKRRWREVARP